MARNTKKMKLMAELKKKGIVLPEGAYFSTTALEGMLQGGPQQLKPKPIKEETDAQVDARIKARFKALEEMVQGTIDGVFPALITSGPPGLGKSYTTEEKLEAYDPNGINSTRIKGNLTAVGLFKQLWDHREEGQILVLDDADSVFFDLTAMNLLKAACDSESKRQVSYLSESVFISEKDSSTIDKRFEFKGTIIFITNYDFDDCIERGHRLAPHMAALKSRAHYISLGLKTRRDYFIRVKQIAELGLFKKFPTAKTEVLEFMEKNLHDLDEVSARMAVKLAGLRKAMPNNWKNMAKVTCFRENNA